MLDSYPLASISLLNVQALQVQGFECAVWKCALIMASASVTISSCCRWMVASSLIAFCMASFFVISPPGVVFQ